MKRINLFSKFIILIIITCFQQVTAQQNVVFDINNLASGVIEKGAGSMNACWLLDSDIHRPRNVSNESRYAEMELGSVRYPYGHLANNYLWDTPPFGGTLEPKVASMSSIPGNWSWATNPDGSMKDIMDFNEFMEICQRQNIKPLVVVNALAHKYNNGPTYAELKATAVEWVKYAKNKGYEVAYWQIGNEMEHHQGNMSKTEYKNLYLDFAAAMKAEDPTAQIGLGVLKSTDYFNTIISANPSLVDFTSTHQYLFGRSFKNYDGWLNHSGANLNSNIARMQNAVNNSSKPNLPILITETNAFGNWDSSNPALFKGLSWFDMLITQQKFQDVAYSYIWNSHSPWGGENGNGGSANVLFNTADNDLTAMGWPIKILNSTVEERYMIPNSKVNGKTYSYGSYTPSTGRMTIYLLNKSLSTVPMTVDINNYVTSTSSYQRSEWTGTDQYDWYPTFSQAGTITFTNNGFTTDLPPHSLVVVQLTEQQQGSDSFFMDNLGATRRLKSNPTDTDAVTTSITDLGNKGKWELIDAGNGYVYIQCVANNKRLQGTSSAVGVHTSIKLVDGSSSGDWVQWKLTPVGSNWYIDNKAHNHRLNITNNTITLGQPTWTGNWVRWKLTNTNETLLLKKNQNIKEEGFSIDFYPNPTRLGNNLTVRYFDKGNSNIRIDIMDLNGRLISKKIFNARPGDNSFNIETNRLHKGMYLISLWKNGNKKETKIIIIN